MYELLIPISSLLFLAVAILKREWGIYLIVLLLPSYQIRFQVFGIPMTFLESIILLLGLAQLMNLIRNLRLFGEIKREAVQYIFIFIFLLAAGISVFVAPDTAKAAGIFKAYFFEAVVFYFLVRLIINSREKLEKLYQILTVLVLYLSIYGLYQFLTLQSLPPSWWAVDVASRRIVSLLNHPNALALVLGPLLAVLIVRRPKTKLTLAAIVFGLTAFYLTFSRAGWLALVATLVGVALFSLSPWLGERGNWSWRKLLLSLSVVILIIFAVPFSRTKLLELTRADDPSKQNRYVLWSAAADMLKKHPLTGAGLTGFREAYKSYPLGPDRVVQNYPHNFFLNFWLETGLLGLLSMIGLLILFYRKVYKAMITPESRNFALAAAAGMSVVVLHSLVDVSYFKNDLSILFWLIYALPFTNIDRS